MWGLGKKDRSPAKLGTLWAPEVSLSVSPWSVSVGKPGGRSRIWRAEAPVTLSLTPHRHPMAAGTFLLLGEPESELQLLLSSPAGPPAALAAGGGAVGEELQHLLLQDHLQLLRALGQQLPEPPGEAQHWPQTQLRGGECLRSPECQCPPDARSGAC